MMARFCLLFVERNEVVECFLNMERTPFKDLRERHDSDPPHVVDDFGNKP